MKSFNVLFSSPEFDSYCETRVTTMGHITEVVTMAKKPLGPPIKKLDKEHYLDLRTGEVCNYKQAETRADNLDSVRRSMAHIRALINTNVTVPENCCWVTLTYADNMTDTKKLYSDYVAFWKRFLRWCKKNDYGKPEYISVIEPQGRGAWHIHAFFIWGGPAPFIPNDSDTFRLMKNLPVDKTTMASLWGHGITKTKSLGDVDNIGAYFSAYLADMPLDEVQALPEYEKVQALSAGDVLTKEFVNEQEQVKDKKFVKGGRLPFYPPGMNLYRCSAGIRFPVVEHMSLLEAKKKVSSAKLTFSRSFEIVSDGVVVNTIRKEYYNDYRQKKQD